MGAGDDVFVWDPGDGSDVVEGGDGRSDTLRFNGTAAAEQFTLSANGNRLRLFRDVGNVTMDTAGVELVDLNGHAVGRGTFEPGWRWSENVKPLAGTDSCQVDHIGYVLEGRMALRMDDGTEREFGPGDAFHMPPGHDAWIVGDEPCVVIDWQGFGNYAKPA